MRFLVSLTAGLILVAAAPAVAAQAAPAQPAAASIAATARPAPKAAFGAGPASATKLDGRPYFTYDASPGGSIEDHIAIVNFADEAADAERVHRRCAATGRTVLSPMRRESAVRKQVGAWLNGRGEQRRCKLRCPRERRSSCRSA